MSAGLASEPNAVACAQSAATQAASNLKHPADLVFVAFSPHFVEHAKDISKTITSTLSASHVIGVSAETVLGGITELERLPGISLLAAHLPGVKITPFTSDDLPPAADTHAARSAMVNSLNAGPDHRATIMFSDPASIPLIKLLPAMSNAIAEAGTGKLLGGVASAGDKPKGNALILDGQILRQGAVGVSLSGPIRIDSIVSQGCRPIGPNLIITKSKANLIQELGGRPAVNAIKAVLEGLHEQERDMVSGGLFIGTVVNEYKDHFGRGDYLIRAVLAADEASGSIAVGDMVRTGQTLRLHARDATTASEDLALLLDAQKLHSRPIGSLLITCNARGQQLFDHPHHDAQTVSRAFAPPPSGAERALGGEPIASAKPSIPLAGFFAQGEIGPIGNHSFLHGHTACLALFRSSDTE